MRRRAKAALRVFGCTNSRFYSEPPSARILSVRASFRRTLPPMSNETPDLFNSDYADMAKALLDAGAEFLLVGGYAVSLHASSSKNSRRPGNDG